MAPPPRRPVPAPARAPASRAATAPAPAAAASSRLRFGEAAIQCRPLQAHAGQGSLQCWQARNHPARQHAAAAAQHQRRGCRRPPQFAHAVFDAAEGLAARCLQARARSGQAQAAAGPLEQRQAKVILQQLQLPADRAVGDVQVLRGAPNAAKAGGGLERAQRIERQQGTAHVRFPDDMRQIISIFRSRPVR
jgi:hypothetical protein